MNPSVLSEALALVARAEASGCTGSVEDAAEWKRLNSELGGIIPAWYSDLVTSVPMIGLNFGWQSSEARSEDDGISWVEWFDAANVRLEMLELHPGVSLLERGYFCVAGSNGTGDQYFVSVHDGDDPPLYQIDHETDEVAHDILARGREMVAPSLSEFFQAARVEAKPSYERSSVLT